MSKIDKKSVEQMFLNKFDCYADAEGQPMPIPAMTFDAVWDLINALPSIDEGFTRELVRQLILAAQRDTVNGNFKGPDYYINNHPYNK